MKTVFDHIRQHLLEAVGIYETKQVQPLDMLRKTQWCPQFESYMLRIVQQRAAVWAIDLAQLMRSRRIAWKADFTQLMRNRLIVGTFRYADIWRDTLPWQRYVASIRRRLAAFEAGGNYEHLPDVANLAMVLWAKRDHPHGHVAHVPGWGLSTAERLTRFADTGNYGHLPYVAADAMMVYATHEHPNKHFHAIDDGEHA